MIGTSRSTFEPSLAPRDSTWKQGGVGLLGSSLTGMGHCKLGSWIFRRFPGPSESDMARTVARFLLFPISAGPEE